MNTNKIKLTESRLKQIISESVKRVLNETISTDYRESLKQLLTKAFTNLDDNEKQFLYDLLNNEPWETIYTALETIKPYNPSNVNESVNRVLNESADGYWRNLLNESLSLEEMLEPYINGNNEVDINDVMNILYSCYQSNERIKNMIIEGQRYFK